MDSILKFDKQTTVCTKTQGYSIQQNKELFYHVKGKALS